MLSVLNIGERVQAGSEGAGVRDAALDSPSFAQGAGVHGTIVAQEQGTAEGYTGTWWEVNWDSAPPSFSQQGWSADVELAPVPPGGDFAKPDLQSIYYTTANIYWDSGSAPSWTNPPNPPGCQLGTAAGNCTWYASGRMLELGYSAVQMCTLLGNANEWASEAQAAGMPVNTMPTVGSVAQLSSSTTDGHVAVVESVNSDGTITVTESSYSQDPSSTADCVWENRTCSPTEFDDFIHVAKGNGSLVNLTPNQPSGWSDKVVVSVSAGSTVDISPLWTTDSLFANWSVMNNGTATIDAGFNVDVYVDGTDQSQQWVDPGLAARNYNYCTGISLGRLSAGTHTVKIVADSTNAIAEYDETDNTYTKTILVQGRW